MAPAESHLAGRTLVNTLRAVYRVVFNRTERLWQVVHGPRSVVSASSKDEAVDAARALAVAHEPSRLMVHGRDGAFEVEWTYGDDPSRPAH